MYIFSYEQNVYMLKSITALVFSCGAIAGAGYQHVRENPDSWEKSNLGLSRSAGEFLWPLRYHHVITKTCIYDGDSLV